MARRKPNPTDNEVILIRNAQIYTTIRFTVCCALIGWFGLQIRIGFVEFTKKEAWESVSLALITAIVSLLAPSVAFGLLLRWVRKFTARTIGRLTRLETEVDPERTTSHMNPDGTDPEESHP
jgi:TRAP-type C4-dicarboxylate transport system permease small subunit